MFFCQNKFFEIYFCPKYEQKQVNGDYWGVLGGILGYFFVGLFLTVLIFMISYLKLIKLEAVQRLLDKQCPSPLKKSSIPIPQILNLQKQFENCSKIIIDIKELKCFIKYLKSFHCETTRITDICQFASFDSLKVVRLRFATSEK